MALSFSLTHSAVPGKWITEESTQGYESQGKTPIAGARDRATRRARTAVVPTTEKPTLQGFIAEVAAPVAQVYTDKHNPFQGMPFPRDAVKHSVGEHVRGQAHANGMEPLRSRIHFPHGGASSVQEVLKSCSVPDMAMRCVSQKLRGLPREYLGTRHACGSLKSRHLNFTQPVPVLLLCRHDS